MERINFACTSENRHPQGRCYMEEKRESSLYPGYQRIFMHDCHFPSSFHSDLCEKLCFVASPLVPGAWGQLRNIPPHARKNFLYPGEDIWLFSLPSSCFLPCGWYSSSWHIALALLSFTSYTFSSTLIVPILHQKLTNLRYNSNRKKLQNGKMKRIWWMGLQPMEFF